MCLDRLTGAVIVQWMSVSPQGGGEAGRVVCSGQRSQLPRPPLFPLSTLPCIRIRGWQPVQVRAGGFKGSGRGKRLRGQAGLVGPGGRERVSQLWDGQSAGRCVTYVGSSLPFCSFRG